MSVLAREPVSVVCMRVREYVAMPHGFVEYASGTFDDGTKYREGVMLPEEHGALAYWSIDADPPHGWRHVVTANGYRNYGVRVIAADSTFIFWRAYFLSREWLRRRLFWIGWVVLRFGCWCAATRLPDAHEIRAAFQEAAGSMEFAREDRRQAAGMLADKR